MMISYGFDYDCDYDHAYDYDHDFDFYSMNKTVNLHGGIAIWNDTFMIMINDI